jgi:hypothetical protein
MVLAHHLQLQMEHAWNTICFLQTKNHEKETQALPAVVYKPYAPQEVGEGGHGFYWRLCPGLPCREGPIGHKPRKAASPSPPKAPFSQQTAVPGRDMGYPDVPVPPPPPPAAQRGGSGRGGGVAPGAPQEWAGPSPPPPPPPRTIESFSWGCSGD